MNLQSIKQDFLYIVVTAIIVSLLYYALPDKNFQPHGILMPAQLSSNAISTPTQDIPVLAEYPKHYQILGNIIITMAFKDNDEKTLNSNMAQCQNKAKTLAEKAGAGSVIILRAAHYNKTMGMNSTVLYAQALY